MSILKDKNKWLLLLFMLVLTACSSSDNDDPQPVPQPSTGANNQLLVIFPVDQLGDQGYADEVMKGVTSLMELNSREEADTLDVMFLLPLEAERMISEIRRWLNEDTNLFYGRPYNRRLLLLTDSYMLSWIKEFSEALKPTDEILVLRAIDEDVKPVAAELGLEGRLHAVNITVAGSVRKFREFVDTCQVLFSDNESFLTRSAAQIPMFRIYPDSIYHYRDSLMETLKEELPKSELELKTFLTEVGDVLWSVEYQKSLIQVSYDMAEETHKYFRSPSTRWSYAVVDLGSANGGWDFYMMYASGQIYATLMLDAQASVFLDRMVITRKFGMAVEEWVNRWLQQPVGTMPVFEGHGTWDEYCTDNIDYQISNIAGLVQSISDEPLLNE